MPDIPITTECFTSHLGPWMMEPTRFRQAVRLVRADQHTVIEIESRQGADARDLYHVTSQGVAVIPVDGPLAKFDSKFGGTNTVRVRRALRDAVDNSDVDAILLHVDSPGGHVAGTQELADDIRRADAVKPVHAHADDLMASAAYWVAAGARRISANRTAEVGSIGVVAVVEDTSEEAALAGIQVHVVSTGKFKGAFADGAPVLPEHLDYLQARIDDLHSHFLQAVEQGRKLSGKALEAVSDGRVWGAAEAQTLGLIDAVESLDDAMASVGALAEAAAAERRKRRMKMRGNA